MPNTSKRTSESRNRLIQNTIAVGVMSALVGLEFETLEDSLSLRFQRQGEKIVSENVGVARAGTIMRKPILKPSQIYCQLAKNP
ncbi:MAG: hypothetical protein CM1200mP15_13760 [Dehalococcoidia bacterium]|nr:MAG: hypothetical protein CM1200mP15_13760 [Dehalococcoidia bacterium]